MLQRCARSAGERAVARQARIASLCRSAVFSASIAAADRNRFRTKQTRNVSSGRIASDHYTILRTERIRPDEVLRTHRVEQGLQIHDHRIFARGQHILVVQIGCVEHVAQREIAALAPIESRDCFQVRTRHNVQMMYPAVVVAIDATSANAKA